MDKQLTEDFIKSVKKEYYRNYRKQHPEKYKEASKRYWAKKAEKLKNGGLQNGE